MQKVELMAPAGSYESLRAAIHAGCDSIYFGITQLNMRANSANNFTLEDLKQIAKICHKNNIKAYLALNTILYDHDMILMKNIVDAVKESSIDSIIAADIAAIQYAREKGVNVHISTQLSVSNVETVKFWSQYADIVVLARELDLKMIKHVCEEIERQQIKGPSGKLIRIEAFAHGAMCVAISGRCGMSLYTDNSSANRGACKQNCRRPYIVTDKKSGAQLEINNQYVMSPKDLCTIDFLDEFIATGVQVLKIEGRGRSPDYVDQVIRCYKEALTSLEEGTYTKEKINKWMERLGMVYNRGLSSGYYLGKQQGQWSGSDNSLATEEKIFIGEVSKYFPKAQVVEVNLQAHELNIEDEVFCMGVTTGIIRMQVKELRNDDEKKIQKAEKQTTVSFPVPERVRKNDKIYLIKKRLPYGA